MHHFHDHGFFDGEVPCLLPETFVPAEARGVIDCTPLKAPIFTWATNLLASMKLRVVLFTSENSLRRLSWQKLLPVSRDPNCSSRSTSLHPIHRRCHSGHQLLPPTLVLLPHTHQDQHPTRAFSDIFSFFVKRWRGELVLPR